MRSLFLLLLPALIISCSPGKQPGAAAGQPLPTGIYRFDQRSDTGTIAFFSQPLYGHEPGDSIYVRRIPVLSEKRFIRISLQRPFAVPGGGKYIYLVPKEAVENDSLALIIDGKLAGILNRAFTDPRIPVAVFEPNTGFDSLEEKLAGISAKCHFRDSVAGIRPQNGEWKDQYENGRLKISETYKNGTAVYIVSYFPSGKISGESYQDCDTCPQNAAVERTFYENGRLASYAYRGSEDRWTASWYPNGQPEKVDSISVPPFFQPQSGRRYDSLGRLTYSYSVRFEDPFPGDTGRSNRPQLVYEKRYRSGKLFAEGAIYRNCAECDADSAGLWKFYDEGKMIYSRNFPSGQSLYREARSEARVPEEE